MDLGAVAKAKVKVEGLVVTCQRKTPVTNSLTLYTRIKETRLDSAAPLLLKYPLKN